MAVSSRQKRKIKRVMGEYKHGALRSSSGAKVRNRKQAVAIAMSESGQSWKTRKSPKGKKSRKSR